MDDLQKDALDVYSRVNELSIEADELESDLQRDPRYLRMQAARLEAENLMEEFKERALTTLQINGEKTSVGDFGKITLVSRETYKVADEKRLAHATSPFDEKRVAVREPVLPVQHLFVGFSPETDLFHFRRSFQKTCPY